MLAGLALRASACSASRRASAPRSAACCSSRSAHLPQPGDLLAGLARQTGGGAERGARPAAVGGRARPHRRPDHQRRPVRAASAATPFLFSALAMLVTAIYAGRTTPREEGCRVGCRHGIAQAHRRPPPTRVRGLRREPRCDRCSALLLTTLLASRAPAPAAPLGARSEPRPAVRAPPRQRHLTSCPAARCRSTGCRSSGGCGDAGAPGLDAVAAVTASSSTSACRT